MTTAPDATAAAPHDADEITARGSTEYRVRRYILILLMVGAGLWFAYDGWVGYPADNAKAAQLGAAKMPHSDLDITIQKILAFTLPPLGLALLAWTLYNSRGTIRLRGDVLHAPGHGDVPLDAVRQIDKTDWDRKGIAYLDYQTPAGRPGRVRLDDFVYEMKPIQSILKQLEAKLLPPEETAPAPTTEDAV